MQTLRWRRILSFTGLQQSGSTPRSRQFAILTICALIVAALSSPSPSQLSHTAAYPRSLGDLELYEKIAKRVGEGHNYYPVAADLQRQNRFPLRPFFTVRLPSLAYYAGYLGPTATFASAALLAIANCAIWFRAITFARPAERVVIAFLVGVSSITVGKAIYLHEWWAGVLVSMSLGLFVRRSSLWWLVPAGAALLVREFSVLFLLAALTLRWRRHAAREVALACTMLALFSIALAAHYVEVRIFSRPNDLSSQGWLGLHGLIQPVIDLQRMLPVDLIEPWGTLLVLVPLIGWSEVAHRQDILPLLWFSGFLFLVAVGARTDNIFWVRMVLPAYMAGLALVPRAIAAAIAKPDCRLHDDEPCPAQNSLPRPFEKVIRTPQEL